MCARPYNRGDHCQALAAKVRRDKHCNQRRIDAALKESFQIFLAKKQIFLEERIEKPAGFLHKSSCQPSREQDLLTVGAGIQWGNCSKSIS